MKNFIKNLKLKRRGITLLAKMHFFGNPSKKLKIVGVTGTNGKTTTATLLYRITIALGHKAGLIGTVENIINGERVPATHTTPDPISLHNLLKEMLNKECEYIFMEVSSHALDQSRVAGLNFTGGIFTNLTHDHLDYHKNFENYFGAKKKLFKMLSKTAFALSNIDDEYGIGILEGIKARKFFYGLEDRSLKHPAPSHLSDIWGNEYFYGKILKMNFAGLEIAFNGEKIKSGLLGKFNAHNLLAVWSACKLLGFDLKKVKNALEEIKPPRGRFEHFLSPNGVLIIVDYAHSPDALEKVLLAVKEIKTKEGKIISIFGCGGDRDPIKRKIMGYIGATLSDIAIFTSDNPRSEDQNKIIDQMTSGLSSDDFKKIRTITNRHEAILEGIKLAQKGDIILCAGKGHEDYQEIKGVRHHFNDMEEFKNFYE